MKEYEAKNPYRSLSINDDGGNFKKLPLFFENQLSKIIKSFLYLFLEPTISKFKYFV